MIVGAGHVGQAVADLAAQADFDVWVVDDRQQYANAERFPAGRSHPRRADRRGPGLAGGHAADLRPDRHPRATATTRRRSITWPRRRPSYVGLIGSRRKIRLIFEGLREQGIAEAALERVAAPVGLDIGSQSVVEIAISIVAELIARRNLGRRQAPRSARSSRRGIMIAAVVPAAGRSARMGRPKLLLEFDGESLIHRVVTALREGGADRVVVVPPVDAPEAAAIAAEAAAAGAEVLVPESQPAEMRDSVELGLAVLDAEPRPTSVLLTPGDVPGITAGLVARLLDVARDHPDRHRHPDPRRPSRTSRSSCPGTIAVRVRDLPDDAGVNRLVDAHRDRLVEVSVAGPGADRRPGHARGPGTGWTHAGRTA